MTGKERVLRIIAHKEADRIPKYDAFWEDTLINWHATGLPYDPVEKYEILTLESGTKIIGNTVGDYFGFDIDMFYLDNSMRFTPIILEDHETYSIISDRCGYTVKRFKNKGATMHFINHVNPDRTSWEKIKSKFVPDMSDTSRIDHESFFLRTSRIPSWSETKIIFDKYRKRDKFLLLNGYGPFEGTWRHHGYTSSLVDMLCDKNLMKEMFESITHLTLETIKHAIDMGMKPDGYFMIEDLGYTHSTLFSPDLYKEVLWPYHKMLGDFLHREGIYFFIHSCGKIDTLLPYFIDAGVDVVQPLQANTGMDVRDLKRMYKKDLTFWGNINEIELSKSFEDIEREIAGKVTEAMKDGGYIYHSDHSIPPTVSFENYRYVMKMLDKYGKYDVFNDT